MQDTYSRTINYLRISLTDLCNFRCRYCMPESGIRKKGHKEILQYEEFLRVVEAAVSVGVKKIRLTGGEPLVRRNIVDFVRQLNNIKGLSDIRLTTNGMLLAPMAEKLKRAGLKRVNISLDSLDPKTFQYITGRDDFEKVWVGLLSALDAGFEKVKINCVAIDGVNDSEFKQFARLTQEYPIDVRFIEFMPLGRLDFWSWDRVIGIDRIKTRIETLGELTKEDAVGGVSGPAQMYRLKGALGRIGFISPMTDHFCGSCNRLRLTAEGKIRPCLMSDLEIDIKECLREGADAQALARVLLSSALKKPKAHLAGWADNGAPGRSMNTIGG